jgi:hypothetical protein
MKRCQSLLICVLAMFSASAESSDARPLPPYASFAVNSATATAVDFSAQTALSAGLLRGAWTPQANVVDFGSDVVKDMKATSVFVQEQAAKAGTPDSWLIALAALGLVVLQLRRKHRPLHRGGSLLKADG